MSRVSYLPGGIGELMEALEGSRGRRPLVRLERAALIILDLQRIFVAPDSPAYLPAWAVAAEGCGRLLAGARARGLPVVWTRHIHPPQDRGGTIAHFFGRLLREDDPLSALPLGGVAPLEGEDVVVKARHSPFVGTDLTERLRARGVEAVILAGVQVQLCVLAGAIDAGGRGFLPVVALDATAGPNLELHRAALLALSSGLAHVSTVEEILTIL